MHYTRAATALAVLFLASIAALLPATYAESDHIIFFVRRGDTQCFMLTAPAGDTLSGEVRVANGPGDMPIGFWLLVGSTNDVLLTKSDVDHEKFSVVAPRGPHHGHDYVSTPSEYKLCVFQRKPFKGGGATDTRKVFVTFDATTDPDAIEAFGDANSVTKGLALQKDVKEIGKLVDKIQHAVAGIIEEIDTIRSREQVLFDVSTSVANQIWIMGVLSCVAVIAAGYLQLYQTNSELHSHSAKILAKDSQNNPRDRRRPAPRTSAIQLRRSLGSLGSFSRLTKLSENGSQVLPSHTSQPRRPDMKKATSEKSPLQSRSAT